jgi:hypothetical protein
VSRWPFCLAEIGLYSLLAGLVIGMALDARDRWRQLRQLAGTAARNSAEHDPGDGLEVSTVRRRPDVEHNQGDDTPPPLAS